MYHIYGIVPSSQAVHYTSSFLRDLSKVMARPSFAALQKSCTGGTVSDVSLFAPGRGQLAWHYRRAAQGAVSDVSLFAPCRGQLALALQTSCAGGS